MQVDEYTGTRVYGSMITQLQLHGAHGFEYAGKCRERNRRRKVEQYNFMIVKPYNNARILGHRVTTCRVNRYTANC